MPSQQRFEGPDLEELLADVRGRFGAGVRIVEANRIRKGGVGGFFAKELFEVVVDEDDQMTPDAMPAPRRGLLDLVDSVDDGPAPTAAGDQLASEATVQALLRMTEDLRDDRVAEEAPITGRAMDALLARIGNERAPGDGPISPTAATMSTDGEAFAQVLGRMTRSARAGSDPDEDLPFRSYADVARDTGGDPVTPVPARRVEAAPMAADRDPDPVPAEAIRGQRVRPEPDTTSMSIALDRTSLVRLGLPEQYATRTGDAPDRLSALLDLAATFPVAPRLPDAGDTVIALVGDRTGMDRAVAWIQDHLGLAPDTLMLASRAESSVFPENRRITGYDDATVRRQSWRRRRRPVLVAVDAGVGIHATTWTRHILDALEPAAVWGVVSATRKPEDVVEWGERIGGIDAIALHGTEETMSPAAVLTTGLPVCLIDGHSATPARWAAVLDERLAACA